MHLSLLNLVLSFIPEGELMLQYEISLETHSSFISKKYFNAFTYENILLVFAFSIVIYGVFIAFALHLGPWKKISQS